MKKRLLKSILAGILILSCSIPMPVHATSFFILLPNKKSLEEINYVKKVNDLQKEIDKLGIQIQSTQNMPHFNDFSLFALAKYKDSWKIYVSDELNSKCTYRIIKSEADACYEYLTLLAEKIKDDSVGRGFKCIILDN